MFFRYLILFVCGSVSGGFGAVLVKDHRPVSVIVMAQDCPDSVRYAAGELQNYLQQVTGAKPAVSYTPKAGLISIFLGKSKFTDALGLNIAELKPDGFKIVSGKEWVAILGRDYAGPPIYIPLNPFQYHEVYNDALKLGAFGETGTLYGVYRFLETYCGVRWYMPGDLGTVITKQDTVEVKSAQIKASPVFEYRYVWFCNIGQSEPDARWYRRAGFGAPYPIRTSHSFWMFTEKYKDQHPDYFALIGGQRDTANLSCSQTGRGNLCLSNPKVAAQWIADINDYFDRNPNQSIYPVAPNDGMEKICECKACQAQLSPELGTAGKFSNYIWSFVNKVTQGVAVRHPDKYVGCIAYEHYRVPPSAVKTLHPNVAVMICNAIYPAPGSDRRTEELIKQWRQKGSHNLYYYDYYLYSWKPWRNLPVIFPHQIAARLKYLQGDFKGEFIEAESNEFGGGNPPRIECPGMAHLNLYMTARLQWNPELNVDAVLDEYYEKFYGPARAPMKKFWTLAEDIWTARQTLGDPLKMYRPSDIKQLSSYLDQASAQTAPDSIYRKRVELIQREFLPAKRKLSNELILNPPRLSLAGPLPAVHLDGKVDDPAWRIFTPVEFVNAEGEPATFKTHGYAAWDAENLYLAFVNEEPQMNKVVARANRRDQNFDPGMWEDDSVEIFICPDNIKRGKTYQFIINAKGFIWDAMKPAQGAPMDTRWNSRAQAATRFEPDRWVVEIKIPFEDLGIDLPAEGKTCAVNFYRTRFCGRDYSYTCWSPTLMFQHDIPGRFGQMTFKKNLPGR